MNNNNGQAAKALLIKEISNDYSLAPGNAGPTVSIIGSTTGIFNDYSLAPALGSSKAKVTMVGQRSLLVGENTPLFL